MANMSLVKNPMPSQDPNVRNKNFDEVALGYTKEQAIDEAQRCLNCKNKACMTGCPVMVRIPEFIAAHCAAVKPMQPVAICWIPPPANTTAPLSKNTSPRVV